MLKKYNRKMENIFLFLMIIAGLLEINGCSREERRPHISDQRTAYENEFFRIAIPPNWKVSKNGYDIKISGNSLLGKPLV